MSKTISHRFFFQSPPESVWEYLTKPELISQWLMENDFQPVIGWDFKFRTRPMPNFDFDGIIYCKVLEIVPFRKLVYSWKGGPGNGEIRLDSLVTWTLHSKEGGTELLLNHSGFREVEDLPMCTIMSDGWFRNVSKIHELITSNTHGSQKT